MAKKRVLRVGIIGQGRSGYSIHASHLVKDPLYRIVAVTDPMPERREQARREFGADAYAGHGELLARGDLDLVVNAAPSHLHVPISLEALKAGQNVVCEKPLTWAVKDVDRLKRAARRAGKVMTVFQQLQFAPYFEQVRKVIDSGVLGRIVMIKISANAFARRWDWQTLRRLGGGSLLNWGPHLIDQALRLFGQGKPSVTAVLDRTLSSGDAEDHVKILLTGRGRPTIDIEISSCCAYPSDVYNVYGTQGGLRATQTQVQWKYVKPSRLPKRPVILKPLEDRQYCHEELPWTERSWSPPKTKSNMYPYMAARFYRSLHKTLTEGAPLAVTLDDVRRQVAVIEACFEQNRRFARR